LTSSNFNDSTVDPNNHNNIIIIIILFIKALILINISLALLRLLRLLRLLMKVKINNDIIILLVKIY
jgi:hypothetical protein